MANILTDSYKIIKTEQITVDSDGKQIGETITNSFNIVKLNGTIVWVKPYEIALSGDNGTDLENSYIKIKSSENKGTKSGTLVTDTAYYGDVIRVVVACKDGYKVSEDFETTYSVLSDLSINIETVLDVMTLKVVQNTGVASIEVKDADGNIITDGASVVIGTRITWTAVAETGYTLDSSSGYVDVISGSNPTVAPTATLNGYTIKFVNYDGTVLQTSTVPYGTTPTYDGDTPTRSATAQYTYSFKSWDKTITVATEDTIYTATYSSTINKYTVTFLSNNTAYGTWDISTTTLEYGSIVGFDNTKFGLWNSSTKSLTTVIATATAVDSTAKYIYSFDSMSVSGATVSDNHFTITGNTTITANFTQSLSAYTVTVKSNNTNWGAVNIAKVENVPYGTIISTSDNTVNINGTTVTATKKDNTAKYTYAFDSWTNGTATVNSDITITANFSATINKYTITWLNDDGSTISTSSVAYDDTPTAPTATKAKTAQYTYTFKAWSPEIVAVTGDATYTASYTATINTYTVTFASTYGSWESKSYTVEYGTTWSTTDLTVTLGSNTNKFTVNTSDAQYTYAFSNISADSGTVTSNTTIYGTASRTINQYAIDLNPYINGTHEYDGALMHLYIGDTDKGNVKDYYVKHDYGTSWKVTEASYSKTGYTTSCSTTLPKSGTVTGNTEIRIDFTRSANTYTLAGTFTNGSVTWYSDANFTTVITSATYDSTVYYKTTANSGYTGGSSGSLTLSIDNFTMSGSTMTHSFGSATPLTWSLTLKNGDYVTESKYSTDGGSTWSTLSGANTSTTISSIGYSTKVVVKPTAYSTTTDQYTYSWASGSLTGETTYSYSSSAQTATFSRTRTTNTYSIALSGTYGTWTKNSSSTTISATSAYSYGTSFTVDSTKGTITIGSDVYTFTKTADTAQYSYSYTGLTVSPSGQGTIIKGITITAGTSRSDCYYDVTVARAGVNATSQTINVKYGTTVNSADYYPATWVTSANNTRYIASSTESKQITGSGITVTTTYNTTPQYYITIGTCSNATANRTTGWYSSGTVITWTATTNTSTTRYAFSTSDSTVHTYTQTISSSTTYSGSTVYIWYKWTASNDTADGYWTVSATEVWIRSGTSASVTYTLAYSANDYGYTWDNVTNTASLNRTKTVSSGNVTGTGDFNTTGNISASYLYGPFYYWTAPSGTNCSPSVSYRWVKTGNSYSFTYSANSNYSFSSGNTRSSLSTSTSVSTGTVSTKGSVSAPTTYGPYYKYTAANGTNCTVNTTSIYVLSGQSYTFTWTATSGYSFNDATTKSSLTTTSTATVTAGTGGSASAPTAYGPYYKAYLSVGSGGTGKLYAAGSAISSGTYVKSGTNVSCSGTANSSGYTSWGSWTDSDATAAADIRNNASAPELSSSGGFSGTDYVPFVSIVWHKNDYASSDNTWGSSTIPGWTSIDERNFDDDIDDNVACSWNTTYSFTVTETYDQYRTRTRTDYSVSSTTAAANISADTTWYVKFSSSTATEYDYQTVEVTKTSTVSTGTRPSKTAKFNQDNYGDSDRVTWSTSSKTIYYGQKVTLSGEESQTLTLTFDDGTTITASVSSITGYNTYGVLEFGDEGDQPGDGTFYIGAAPSGGTVLSWDYFDYATTVYKYDTAITYKISFYLSNAYVGTSGSITVTGSGSTGSLTVPYGTTATINYGPGLTVYSDSAGNTVYITPTSGNYAITTDNGGSYTFTAAKTFSFSGSTRIGTSYKRPIRISNSSSNAYNNCGVELKGSQSPAFFEYVNSTTSAQTVSFYSMSCNTDAYDNDGSVWYNLAGTWTKLGAADDGSSTILQNVFSRSACSYQPAVKSISIPAKTSAIFQIARHSSPVQTTFNCTSSSYLTYGVISAFVASTAIPLYCHTLTVTASGASSLVFKWYSNYLSWTTSTISYYAAELYRRGSACTAYDVTGATAASTSSASWENVRGKGCASGTVVYSLNGTSVTFTAGNNSATAVIMRAISTSALTLHLAKTSATNGSYGNTVSVTSLSDTMTNITS